MCPECKEIMGNQERTVRETLLSIQQVPHTDDSLGVPTSQLVTLEEETEIVFKKSEQLLYMD